MSNFSIEKQIEIIRDINDQKHRKIERQEQRIREQEYQITLMQSVIYSMQKQLREQSKLIASLQSHLVVNKKEVEVDMFADWLND
jgi:uncharacterized coiled-coil protein SlyX